MLLIELYAVLYNFALNRKSPLLLLLATRVWVCIEHRDAACGVLSFLTTSSSHTAKLTWSCVISFLLFLDTSTDDYIFCCGSSAPASAFL